MLLRGATLLASLVTLVLSWSAAFGDEGSYTLPTNVDEPVIVRLAGDGSGQAGRDPSTLLQVFVGEIDECCDAITPMAGRYEKNGETLSFTPTFGFIPDQNYVLRLNRPLAQSEDGPKRIAFSIESNNPAVDVEVVGIFPSGDILPENVLRFYIHFARPMKPHVSFDYIKLLDAQGNHDDAAFMRFKQELWNEDRTRLTRLMDPGRIKRGVATNERLGPALLEGNRYQLVVEDGWPTADGNAVLTGFSKSFEVSEGLRELPNTDLWAIDTPGPGTTDPIVIRFDRPFDNVLLRKSIRIVTETGQTVAGEIHVSGNEHEWRFTPNAPWRSPKLQLVLDSALEDVAGNNFKDLLDHEVGTGTLDVSQVSVPIALTP